MMAQTKEKHEETEPTIAWQIGVYVGLMVLLALTVGANHLQLGKFALTVALLIAAMKAILVILYFMHVRFSSRMTAVFVTAGFLWLAIFFSLTFDDYLSRDWLTRTNDVTASPTPVPPPPGMSRQKDPDDLALHKQFGR
jgi:cytochrome c oxidase subunit 4